MFELGHVDDAIEHLQFALELDPENHDAHRDLGHYYCNVERWDDAHQHILKALRINPDSAKSNMPLGIILAQKGMTDVDCHDQSPALSALRKTHELYPDDESIVDELANALITHNLIDEAERLISSVMTRRTIRSLRLDAMFKKQPQPVT